MSKYKRGVKKYEKYFYMIRLHLGSAKANVQEVEYMRSAISTSDSNI